MKELLSMGLSLVLDHCETYGIDDKEEVFLLSYVKHCEESDIELDSRVLDVLNSMVKNEEGEEEDTEYMYRLSRMIANCSIVLSSDEALDDDSEFSELIDLKDWKILSVEKVVDGTGIVSIDGTKEDRVFVVGLILQLATDIEEETEDEMVKSAMIMANENTIPDGDNFSIKVFEPFAEDADIVLRPI